MFFVLSCVWNKNKFWVPMRNWTSDLQIPYSDVLPLSHRKSTVSKVYHQVHMTHVLHTAGISNVDSIMGNFFLCPTLVTRWKRSFSIFLPSSKLTISLILLTINGMLQWLKQLHFTGREIAPNTGANATKFFTLATKSWKLVAKLATRMFYHNLSKRYSELNFVVKFVSKTQHMHPYR